MNRHVSFGLGLVGVVGLVLGTTGRAQTTSVPVSVTASPPGAVSTNVQDFSQGFRTFIRLGLPDTSKAKYVKLSYYNGMYDISARLYELSLSGNAWLISENKDDKSVLISATGRTLELVDQKNFMKKQEAEARSNAVVQAAVAKKGDGKLFSMMSSFRVNQGDQVGSWIPVDLSRDLAKATAYIDKKIKAKAAGGREMRYDSFLQSDESSGMLFILAAFAWQNGMTQEANLLAGRLFTLVGDSRKVIVGALNVMADAQLAATADTFRKTGDWNIYHDAVVALVKKYPSGWRKAGAAQLLADRLQVRAAMVQPPAVTGEDLSEEDRQLAAALVSATNQTGMPIWSGQLWILPPAKAMRMVKDDSVIGRIKARGVKSLPLLIALANDETLCPLRRSDVGMPITYTSYSSSDSGRPEAERTQTYYKQMDRPLTRGELAQGLLAPLCRCEENVRHGESEVAPEEVIEGAKQVYGVLKNLPPAGWASHFLKNGDQNQKQAAIGYMLENDFETNAPVIEAFLLTPPSDETGAMMMGYGNGLAQQYVQKRGEKAADFVEKYVAMREKIELPSGMADNAEYVKQIKKQSEQEIKTLRALVKKQDLTTTVAELANSGDGNETAMAAYTALGHQPPAKAVPALLAVAVKATNVTVRVRILQMMPMLRYSGMQEAAQAEMAEAGQAGVEAAMKKLAEKNKLTIGTNAADWKILMADTRSMPGGNMFTGGAYHYTIADLAAGAIETLYGDTSLMEQYGHRGGGANLNPEVMMKVTRIRAAARLEGNPEDQLPKFPSAADVTAARRKEIEDEVLKAPPATLAAVLEKLTDSESLFLTELSGEKEAIMKAMIPLTRRIVSVKIDPALPAVEAARLQKLSGTMVGTNTIVQMREICQRQLATGSVFAIALSSGGLGKGLLLNVIPGDDKAQNMLGYSSMLSRMGGVRKGMVMGMLRSGQNNGFGMWLVDLPTPAKVTGAATGTVVDATADSDDTTDDHVDNFANMFGSQQEQFDSAVETFCNAAEPIGPGASVSFTGMIPSKSKDKDSVDEADEVSVDRID